MNIDREPNSTSVPSSCALSSSGFVFITVLSNEDTAGLPSKHVNMDSDNMVMVRIRSQLMVARTLTKTMTYFTRWLHSGCGPNRESLIHT